MNDVVNNYLSGQPGDARKVMNASNPIQESPNHFVWYFEHNLGKYPAVALINTDNQVVVGACEFYDQSNNLSLNHVRISLTSDELSKVVFN